MPHPWSLLSANNGATLLLPPYHTTIPPPFPTPFHLQHSLPGLSVLKEWSAISLDVCFRMWTACCSVANKAGHGARSIGHSGMCRSLVHSLCSGFLALGRFGNLRQGLVASGAERILPQQRQEPTSDPHLLSFLPSLPPALRPRRRSFVILSCFTITCKPHPTHALVALLLSTTAGRIPSLHSSFVPVYTRCILANPARETRPKTPRSAPSVPFREFIQKSHRRQCSRLEKREHSRGSRYCSIRTFQRSVVARLIHNASSTSRWSPAPPRKASGRREYGRSVCLQDRSEDFRWSCRWV